MKYCISIRQNFSICLCLFAFSVLIVNGLPVETWAPKKVNFQEKESQSGKNWACTFVAQMWVWKDGFVCMLFNVIPLSVWKSPNAALQTGMWFSLASQRFWTKTQVTLTVFTWMNKFILSLGFLFLWTRVEIMFFLKTINEKPSYDRNSGHWVEEFLLHL